MKTLLTAFGPFPGMPTNPSELLLRTFAPDFPTELLATEYASAGDKVVRAIDRHRPDLLLMLGVRSRSPAVALERFALNIDDCLTPDAAGVTRRNQPIIPGALPAYETRIDLAALQRTLVTGVLPVEISYHAGTYLCNHAYYRALHHIHHNGLPSRALFVHIPLELHPPGLGHLRELVQRIIQALAATPV